MFKRIQLALDRANYKKLSAKQDLLLKLEKEAINVGNIDAAFNYAHQERDVNDYLINIERRYGGVRPGKMTRVDKLITFFFGK